VARTLSVFSKAPSVYKRVHRLFAEWAEVPLVCFVKTHYKLVKCLQEAKYQPTEAQANWVRDARKKAGGSGLVTM
jgi:hypothetical protein